MELANNSAVRGAVILLLVTLGAGGGWLLSRGLEPFVHEPDWRRTPPPCRVPGAPGPALRPGCADLLETPRGPVPFSVNEDGLRDGARALLLRAPRRVLVVGGGVVEGQGLAAEETWPAQLGARFPAYTFVNGGLGGADPAWLAGRLPELLRIYRPERLLWLLTRADGEAGGAACAGLRDGAARARARGVPLLVVFLPSRAGFAEGLRGCAVAEKIAATSADPAAGPAFTPEALFYDGTETPRPEGIFALSERLLPALSAWLATR